MNSFVLWYSAMSLAFTGLSLWNVWQQVDGNYSSALTLVLRSKTYLIILANQAINILVLFGSLLQYVFFGRLLESESKRVWEKLMNYALFKVIFIGAILEPSIKELLIWTVWFSIVGFMHLFSYLSKDRFQNLVTYSPNAPASVHGRMLTLQLLLLYANLSWFALCLSVFWDAGAAVLLLLTFECFTLFVDTLQTLGKYAIHLWDLHGNGTWEERGKYMYMVEFFTDAIILLATLAHYVQILILHGISFTLIDMLIFLHIRIVFNNLRDKIQAYRNYKQLAENMERTYEHVTAEQLATMNESCAICRERLDGARRLPCGHMFHFNCLRSWLEFHHSCPTCRRSLLPANTAPPRQQGPGAAPNDRQNGWGWLPNMSVQVIRAQVQPVRRNAVSAEMIRAVQDVFPTMAAESIAQDLSVTLSVDQTINNILEGRLVTPVNNNRGAVDNGVTPVNQPPAPVTPVNVPPSSRDVLTPVTPQPSVTPVTTSAPSAPIMLPPQVKDKFGNSSQERHDRFQMRKQAMLKIARDLYKHKQESDTETVNNSNTNNNNTNNSNTSVNNSSINNNTASTNNTNVPHSDTTTLEYTNTNTTTTTDYEELTPYPNTRRRLMLEATITLFFSHSYSLAEEKKQV
eukprot:TRINITY_DN678_c0_g1_i1.p1 TRINITY_DN678_c0_g1~~TRINITY_DN678_c0_g1_i1.p1  ORF type:complete len:630 (+),score=195.77 TRINITY_DN678_c0_g1_i1:81-1970(+)